MFNPDLYNPQEWAKMAKEAGMKYPDYTIDACHPQHPNFTDTAFVRVNKGRDIRKYQKYIKIRFVSY